MKPSKPYTNLDNVTIQPSFKALLQWRKERQQKKKDLSFIYPQVAEKKIEHLKANRTDTTVTWIGHATALLQLGGLNIITDPVWSRFMGFQMRLAKPGLQPEELPKIDIVVISHNHYDHLSFSSLRKLPGEPIYFVPAGLGPCFTRRKFKKVMEFQWWQTERLGKVELTFVPAQHWSKRALFDTNKSLWGGWVAYDPFGGKCIYFAGDSGYFRGFKEIGQRFDIDFAIMPIGAYEPEWFMERQHVSPERAVQAFLDSKARQFIPVHFEAFRLGDDTPAEALKRLKDEWQRKNLKTTALRILDLGETVTF